MDTDAYGAFVTVDVEAISCLFRIGVIGGTQYADLADDVLGGTPRYFRHALECLKRAIEYFRSRSVSVVVHLGDVLAAENADINTQWSALQSFNNVRGKLPGAAWHIAPGASDARCFGPDGVGPAFTDSSAQSRAYYAFFPASRWRVLVLDANDATGGFSAASSAGVPDGVLVGGSGSIGPAQLTWIGAQLSVASAEGEHVLILCNRGLVGGNQLANAQTVHERIAAYPGVVAAVLSLGDGSGHYEKDAHGVHHLSPLAVVGRDINEDAYGCIEVFDDKLKLEMVGAYPDVAKLPTGWPSELYLPHGGAIVRSGDGENLGFFFSFFFFVLNMVRLPLQGLQPVMRMITTSEDNADMWDAEGILPFKEDIAAHPPAATTVIVDSDGPQQPAASTPQPQKSEASTASGAPAADEAGVIV